MDTLVKLTFGRLTVIEKLEKRVHRNVVYKCLCSCGRETEVTATQLKRGIKKSCGCLRKEFISSLNKTHGMCKSPTYSSWLAMKQRCLNPHHHKFDQYGARGITISKEWIDSFETFMSDMGEKPTGRVSIERLDNNGNYEKNNCVWGTDKQQANNRRKRALYPLRDEYGKFKGV